MNNLKKYRESKKLNQTELASVFGITYEWVSRIERGKASPSFKLAKLIAAFFKVPVDKIF